MKKLIILTTIIVIFVVFVIPFVLAFGIKMIPGGDQPPFDVNTRKAIYHEFDVAQVFVSSKDNLTAIGLSLGNPNLKNKKEIILNLTDAGGSTVRKIIINGANVQDGDFIKLVFDPISGSKGVTYTFRLSSLAAGPEEILTVPFSTVKTDGIGPAYYGKEVFENGLPIVTYYKPASHLEVAKGIYSDWIKRLLSR